MTSPLPTHRILAPDLARGAALLGIAVANGITAWSVTGLPAAANELETYAGIIVNDSLWDKIMVVIGTLFVHVRGLPMFATLLGYGIGMILVREQHRGATPRNARIILARRYGALTIIGALHTVFLFYGDIMLTYSLIALVVVLICTFPDRILMSLVGVSAVIGAALIAPWGYSPFDAVAPTMPVGQDGGSGYLIDQLYVGFGILLRMPGQFFIDLMTLGPPILLGFIAGRRGVLEHPDWYVIPMRIAASTTVLVIVGVGIPWGLSALGVLPAEPFWHGINRVAGLWSGPGFVVWIFWGARWLQQHHLSNGCCLGAHVDDRLRAAISIIYHHHGAVGFRNRCRLWGRHRYPHCHRGLGGNHDFCLPVVTHRQARTARDSAPHPRIWEATQRQNADNVICHGM